MQSSLRRTLERRIPEGNFVWTDGTVIGKHKGITHYTIGQRKGLGLAMGRPVVVTEIRPETGEVVIGEADDVFRINASCGSSELDEAVRILKGSTFPGKDPL